MKFINKKIKVSLCFIFLIMAGCSKNDEPLEVKNNVQFQQITPHQTTLNSSLIIDSENTPDQFFKMTVNDRPQFKEERNVSNGRLEQVISNADQSLTIVAIWENLGDKWICKGIIISKSNQITREDLQVFLRLPFRLQDSSQVRDAILHNSPYTHLNSGAGFTIEQNENRIEYSLY